LAHRPKQCLARLPKPWLWQLAAVGHRIAGCGQSSASRRDPAGTLKSLERDEVKQVIIRNGGKAASGVSGALTFAVIGEKAGPSKLNKLQELGVPMISEDEFFTSFQLDLG